MELQNAVLGIELGSTRIKAVLIDEQHNCIATGISGMMHGYLVLDGQIQQLGQPGQKQSADQCNRQTNQISFQNNTPSFHISSMLSYRCGRKITRVDCRKTFPVSVFGGRDSVKGNRQGALSRSIRDVFQTFQKFEKRRQLVKKTFLTG